MLLETGEYFASERERKTKELVGKKVASKKKSIEKRNEREQIDETPVARTVKASKNTEEVAIEERIKQKLKRTAEKSKPNDASDFMEGSSKKS
jgi:hypothetical protein